MERKLLLFSDGGARGNPGPSAIAFIATTPSGMILKSDSCYIGIQTNNKAEYRALLFALKYALEQKIPEVTCHLDSELVAKQLNGQYSVKNPELKQLFMQVQTLKNCFKKICFVNLPRSHAMIEKTDALVNKTLDEHARNL